MKPISLFSDFRNLEELQFSLDLLKKSNRSVRVGDPRVIAFLDDLSKKLFSLARVDNSLAPLAFFLRKSNSNSIIKSLNESEAENAFRVPQGLVFHIPPTNVDTLFLYSLGLSLLAGNSNIVRISPNAGPTTFQILDVVSKVLENHIEISRLILFIQFDRNVEYLNTISAVVDLRIIWGGNQAIANIRQSPISPKGKEITFPDRQSLAVVKSSTWLTANDSIKTEIIEGLYTDTFLFDQMACSSPQQIIIVGEQSDSLLDVRDDLLQRLNAYAEQRYEFSTGQSINKMISVIAAISRGATSASWFGNCVVSVENDELTISDQIRPGGGFFVTQSIQKLSDLVPKITPKIQTLTYFGFSRNELTGLIMDINGKGIDRLVPIGKALQFNQIWDGKNLIQEFTKIVLLEI